MEAIREDEVAAGVLGIDLPTYKLTALVASAMLAGLAGAFDAHVTSFIGPGEYGFDAAVTILSFALLGGIGSPFGPVAGAFVLTLMPELLRPLHDFRLVFNGLIIVLVVLFMPRGVLGWRIGRMAAGRCSRHERAASRSRTIDRSIRRPRGPRSGLLRGRGGIGAWPHRAERRRQDDDLQCHFRPRDERPAAICGSPARPSTISRSTRGQRSGSPAPFRTSACSAT